MRRFTRCAFVGLLAVALVLSGSVLGMSSHAVAHEGTHAHHASGDVASGGASAHHHHMQHETAPQDNADDPKSMTCCTMCTVASPLPPAASPFVQFVVSPAEYLSQSRSGIALIVSVDPGIPKRTG
jgi:hypothetical protein